MRKITLLSFILISLFLIPGIYANEIKCTTSGVTGICIEIEFITVGDDYKTPSKYEFPSQVQINDYLLIKKLTVLNKGMTGVLNDTTPEFTLEIDSYPFRFEKNEVTKFDSTMQSTIRVPPLEKNEVYELTYQNDWMFYESTKNNITTDNGQFPIYPKKLFTDGEWIIDEKIHGLQGHSTVINGGWKNNFFKVYSSADIDNLEAAMNNQRISKLSLYVVFLIGIVTIFIGVVTIYIEVKLSRNQEKSLKKITEELKKVIQTITKTNQKQINEKKKAAIEEKKRIIENLKFEFEDNLRLVKNLMNKKDEYLRGELGVPMMNFSTTVMNNVLSSGIIENPVLNSNVYLLKYTYEMQNNFLMFMRFGIFDKKTHLKKVIDNLESMMDELQKISKHLNEYLKQL